MHRSNVEPKFSKGEHLLAFSCICWIGAADVLEAFVEGGDGAPKGLTPKEHVAWGLLHARPVEVQQGEVLSEDAVAALGNECESIVKHVA